MLQNSTGILVLLVLWGEGRSFLNQFSEFDSDSAFFRERQDLLHYGYR